MQPLSSWSVLAVLVYGAVAFPGRGTGRELIRDPHFQQGFFLLEPKPGQRIVYGKLAGAGEGRPIWDLAQWSSRFPLRVENSRVQSDTVWTNLAKRVAVGRPGIATADLSLGVFASAEYPEPRQGLTDPWVHLLVQQEFVQPPELGSLKALNFRLEARLKSSTLAQTNGHLPAIHAAQFLVYLTVGNRNPESPGYQECFWFGIPIYDSRERVVAAYEAQDFGDTKLFICTPSSDTFATESTHDGQWVTFGKDILPLIRTAQEQAAAKGFIKSSVGFTDFRPLGIFIGWEVPGTFDVDLQIRNLSLRAE